MDQNQPSIKEQREQKRLAKLARRENQNRRGRTQRWGLWVGGFIAIGAVIAGMVYVARPAANNTNSAASVPGIQANDHIKGPKDAPAVLIEYSDLQCPACKAYHPLVDQLISEFGNKLTVVYRHFPLRQIHQYAQIAALSAEAAGQQGKFWEYAAIMFDRQGEWTTAPNPRDSFTAYAKELKLDTDRFSRDMDSSAAKNAVDADVSSGTKANIQGTPTFFLNNEKLTNPATFDAFKKLVDDAIKNRPLHQVASTKVHTHADLLVSLDGKIIDFAQAKYQETKDKELNPKIHFHSGVGKLFHVHEDHATLNDLFTSIGMKLTTTCFTLDGKDSCDGNGKTLKLIVNGKENTEGGEYQPQDLDRIAIMYGNMTPAAITAAASKVTDEACIFSEKCPERGAPPTEECVGGLGTDCE